MGVSFSSFVLLVHPWLCAQTTKGQGQIVPLVPVVSMSTRSKSEPTDQLWDAAQEVPQLGRKLLGEVIFRGWVQNTWNLHNSYCHCNSSKGSLYSKSPRKSSQTLQCLNATAKNLITYIISKWWNTDQLLYAQTFAYMYVTERASALTDKEW